MHLQTLHHFVTVLSTALLSNEIKQLKGVSGYQVQKQNKGSSIDYKSDVTTLMKFAFFYKVCILKDIKHRRQIWGTITNKHSRNKSSKLLCNQTLIQQSNNYKPI